MAAKGVQISRESLDNIVFVKLYFPLDLLQSRAELLQLRLPLDPTQRNRRSVFEPSVEDDGGQPQDCLSKYSRAQTRCLSLISNEISFENEDNSALFRESCKTKFLHHNNEQLFFTPAQRGLLCWSILTNTVSLGPDGKHQLGIRKFLSKGYYTAAFAPHDSDISPKPSPLPTVAPSIELDVAASAASPSVRAGGEPPCSPTEKGEARAQHHVAVRSRLAHTWAGLQFVFRRQPLADIRRYYGEKIAMYFAWLGMYTTWLVVPAVVGLMTTLYGVIVAAAVDRVEVRPNEDLV